MPKLRNAQNMIWRWQTLQARSASMFHASQRALKALWFYTRQNGDIQSHAALALCAQGVFRSSVCHVAAADAPRQRCCRCRAERQRRRARRRPPRAVLFTLPSRAHVRQIAPLISPRCAAAA
jgi:hypothetical protein